MDQQQTLFPDPLAGPGPPHSGSRTSRLAAEYIAPYATSLKARVYRYILGCGDDGATDDQIASALDMLRDTARARRIDLRDHDRLVRDSGRTRETRSGRAATVWVATER